MLRLRPLARAWLALIAIAIVAAPANGAHLHLCLDGNEPPATVHLADDGSHHDDGQMQATHHDFDVSLRAEALGKKRTGTLDLPTVVVAAFVLFASRSTPAVTVPVNADSLSEPAPVLTVLPPLRAPPV